MPLNFVEDELVRKYITLSPISSDTLRKYIIKGANALDKKIARSLPNSFGLVLDAWTDNSLHYIAIFAAYSYDNELKTPPLTITPPVDEIVFGARVLYDLISDILDNFKRSSSNLAFITADNATVNSRIAEMLGVPFIGCASHKYNLAAQNYLSESENLIGKVQDLMSTLAGSIKKAGKMRQKTMLEPIIRNKTRWSSTFKMLSR